MGTGYDKVMVVNSFSKTFAMTGWRIGYIISTNLEAMKQVVKIQYYISACSNDAMQYAVLEAMEQAMEPLLPMAPRIEFAPSLSTMHTLTRRTVQALLPWTQP